jgi:hypothetical protein
MPPMRSTRLSRSHGWVFKVLVAIVLIAGLLFFAGMTFIFSDENKAAGESIAVAVEAFSKEKGLYPERLDDLRPKYLAAIPAAGQHWGIVYAVEPDAKQCWVAYQVHRDSFREYDCQKRVWQLLDYDESLAVKHPKAEWIRPTGRS